MIFTKQGFPPIIDDNELAYYNILRSMIEASDSKSSCHLIKTPTSVIIRISPSKIEFYKVIFLNIKEINSMFGLQVEFSKSIKTSKNIVYKIKIESPN